MEKEQELADRIDSEHLKLQFYSALQEGPQGFPQVHDCFYSASYITNLFFFFHPDPPLQPCYSPPFVSLSLSLQHYHADTSTHLLLTFYLPVLCNVKCLSHHFSKKCTHTHTQSGCPLQLTHRGGLVPLRNSAFRGRRLLCPSTLASSSAEWLSVAPIPPLRSCSIQGRILCVCKPTSRMLCSAGAEEKSLGIVGSDVLMCANLLYLWSHSHTVNIFVSRC